MEAFEGHLKNLSAEQQEKLAEFFGEAQTNV
jgi:hypothetical protein